MPSLKIKSLRGKDIVVSDTIFYVWIKPKFLVELATLVIESYLVLNVKRNKKSFVTCTLIYLGATDGRKYTVNKFDHDFLLDEQNDCYISHAELCDHEITVQNISNDTKFSFY